jgi:E3 SUMO-protein ligase PIAS1
MVFCAAGNTGVQDISFPHQAELKVNGFEVQANLRGLKNKPGSTRPVDITASLRLKPSNYTNSVDLTYALTTKVCLTSGWHLKRTHPKLTCHQKYYVCLLVCRTKPVDTLVSQIQKKIRKESVIAECEWDSEQSLVWPRPLTLPQ